jgi:predicted O-methyltransferase YrrM
MSTSIGLDDTLRAYLISDGMREHPVLTRLREETQRMQRASMQVAPEEGALLAMLVRLLDARRVLEIGTFTGYSSTAMALAMGEGGRIVCCDLSTDWTDIARQAWTDAGVADRVDLRIGPAVETMDALLDEGAESGFDLAFIDADKPSYDAYYEGCLRLVRTGGVIAIDNTLWSGRVADPSVHDESTDAIRALNAKIAADERVEPVIVPVGDGLTLARRI